MCARPSVVTQPEKSLRLTDPGRSTACRSVRSPTIRHLVARRSVLRLCVIVLVGVLGVGTAYAVAGPILRSGHDAKLGSIVVNAKGLTLYTASSEHNGKLKCTGNCVYFWFPVLVTGKGKPIAGKGLSQAKIGTIKRPNGVLQVTYNKLPLYRYYLDRKAGQVKGQGVKDPSGTWYVVSTSGHVVTTKPAGGTSTGNTTTTSGGIGY
jgi:predicted lipoprotein with Yx(FWY)xxD motif